MPGRTPGVRILQIRHHQRRQWPGQAQPSAIMTRCE
jgi:hypothetical protein